jgi:phage shock protein E
MGNFGMTKYTPESKATETGTMTFAQALKDETFVVVDVRTPEEFREGHFPGAINISSGEFDSRISELGTNKARPMALYCRSGARSGGCVSCAQSEGFINCFHFDNKEGLQALVSQVQK